MARHSASKRNLSPHLTRGDSDTQIEEVKTLNVFEVGLWNKEYSEISSHLSR